MGAGIRFYFGVLVGICAVLSTDFVYAGQAAAGTAPVDICTSVLFKVQKMMEAAKPDANLPGFTPVNSKVPELFNVLKDPSRGGRVDISSLDKTLWKELGAQGVKDLAEVFHNAQVKASDDGKNPGASDNLKHISLQYEDLKAAEADLNKYFDTGSAKALDVALLNAAAHDIGKVAEQLGLLSPDVAATFDQALDGETSFTFKRNVLGHGELSMDAIDNIVEAYGLQKKWDVRKRNRVTWALQAASARHNAGYGPLKNNPEQGIYHFWQSQFPRLAQAFRKIGIVVSDEYPKVEGGWMPVLEALVDRGTALHLSFVEKVINQGNIPWTGKDIGNFMISNSRSVVEEINDIATELQKYARRGMDISRFHLVHKYQVMAQRAEHIGQELLLMNDWSRAYSGRPEVSEAERVGWVYYRNLKGWFRVDKLGTVEKYNHRSEWVSESVTSEFVGRSERILVQYLIGYDSVEIQSPFGP